jgi:glutamyl-Q tRNA(Asp) synthetase
MLEDLAWLGIAWEVPVRRQREHMGEYAAALRMLVERGLEQIPFTLKRILRR